MKPYRPFYAVRGYLFRIMSYSGLFMSYRLIMDKHRHFLLKVFAKGGFELSFVKYGEAEPIGFAESLEGIADAWTAWNSKSTYKPKRRLRT